MPEYYINSNNTKYVKDYKMPFLNLLPAVVWSIPAHQYLYPNASFWVTVLLSSLIIALYVYLSMKPIIAAIPCIAGVVILTALLWTPADHIESDVARITVKAIILVIAIMTEMTIWMNATVPWMQKKEQRVIYQKH